MEGTDASTLFVDEPGNTWTANGNAQVDTAQKKFGSSSALFDGSGDYLSGANNADFAFGSGDFTIDFWVMPNVNSTTGGMALYDGRPLSTHGAYITIYLDPTNHINFVTNGAYAITGTTLSAGSWYHIALTRSGNATRLFVNGTQTGNTYTDTNSYINGANRPLIGNLGFNLTGYGFNGWIDEFRITKGVARWASNFSPPTSPYQAVTTPTPTPTSGWTLRSFTQDSAHPHAVAAVTENQQPAANYTYDANGNMTCRVEEGVTYLHDYNTENRISSITKLASGDCTTPGNSAAKWDFAYDGDGTRVATMTTQYDVNGVPTGSEWTAYYFGGAYEVRSDNTTIKYYSFAGQMVAMQDGTGLQYFLTDHLGSVVAVTNASGTLISQQRYLPFGGKRTNLGIISQTDYGYTGQRDLDPGMGGLMDYKARFYSPYLNRFIQPDTLIPDPSNPQAWNRYSYVYGNPMRFTDPSGHACVEGTSYCVNSSTGQTSGSLTSYNNSPVRKPDPKKKSNDNPVIKDIVSGDEVQPLIVTPSGNIQYAICLRAELKGTKYDYLRGCSTDTNFTLSWDESYDFEYALHVFSSPGYSFNDKIRAGIEEGLSAAMPFQIGVLPLAAKQAINNNYDALYREIHTFNDNLLDGNNVNQPVNIHIVSGLWSSTDKNNGSQNGITWIYPSSNESTGNAIGIPGSMTSEIINALTSIVK